MRKRLDRSHLLNLTPHEAIVPKEHIVCFCPLLKSKGTRDITYCLYKCPKSKIAKCPEYERVYPSLLSFEIEEKYIEKYGMPVIVVPMNLRKRRKRRAPADKTESE